MAVSVYFGATECGKSFHVSQKILPQWQKFVIFDPTGNFKGADKTFYAPKNEFDVQKIFRELAQKESYRALIVPERRSNLISLCDYSAILAMSLGRVLGKDADASKRVQFVIDEAHQVMSSKFISETVATVIFMGRHDNVDTHIISQDPISVNPSIRKMSTKITSFFINNATESSFLKSKFKSDGCQLIESLPKYFRAEWSTDGDIFVFDKNNKVLKKIVKNDALLASKG